MVLECEKNTFNLDLICTHLLTPDQTLEHHAPTGKYIKFVIKECQYELLLNTFIEYASLNEFLFLSLIN